MWAASRLEWLRPLRVSQVISKTSRIAHVKVKEGRSGPLVFVGVQHEIADAAGTAVIEEQDIVYSGTFKPNEASRPGSTLVSRDWQREVLPDPVLLFRYSALTLNGHRIHYDRRYATEVEGYPGLVVHAPLIAILLLDLLRRNMPDARVSRFAFRAVKPTFDTDPLTICGARADDGRSVSLWAAHADGALAVDATATVA
jgi:3-methylfumaryl-CoA hydratase